MLWIGRDSLRNAPGLGWSGASWKSCGDTEESEQARLGSALPRGSNGNSCAVGQQRVTQQVLPPSPVCSTVLSLCHLSRWLPAIPALPSREKWHFPPGEAQLGSSMRQKHSSCWRFGAGELWVLQKHSGG